MPELTDNDLTAAERRLTRSYGAPALPAPRTSSSRPVVRRDDLQALAEALRSQLHRERNERAELEHLVDGLRDELRTLRAEVGVEKRTREAIERLDRLEASQRTGLRSVS